MTANQINEIIGIKESFELPERMMQILEDEQQKNHIFAEFLKIQTDLSFDWFTNYFQEQHSNRDNMMQDFTPISLCKLLPDLVGEYSKAADICAGTGGLTIGAWNKNKDALFYCAELSARAFPLLLFNLAIRNINAVAVRTDILTGEIFEAYRITPTADFSDITRIKKLDEMYDFDYVMMNPPYSLKHKWDEKTIDVRFDEYGYPPSQFSDYAFIMHGLHMMRTDGALNAIVPHGVLFRGAKESAIRKKILENGLLSSVIGLPEKLFINTGIPVCVMNFKKSNDLLFVEASREFESIGKQNVLNDCHIKKIISAVISRAEIEKYAHVANANEIEANDYNLNIPRYVNTYEPEPLPDIVEVTKEIAQLEKEIRKTDCELLAMLKELRANGECEKDLQSCIKIWEDMCNGFTMQRCDTSGDSDSGTSCERENIPDRNSIHSGECLQTVEFGTIQKAGEGKHNRKQVCSNKPDCTGSSGLSSNNVGEIGKRIHGTVCRDKHQYSDGSVQLLLTEMA